MAREGWHQAVGARPVSLLSRGSKNHHRGQCNPCRNFFTEAGCKDGQRCNFCHMPHTQEWLSHASLLRERHQAEVKSKQRREGGGQRESHRSDRGGRGSATSSYIEGAPAPFFEPPPVPYPSSWQEAPFWPEPGYQSMAAPSQIIHVPQVPHCASRFEVPSQGQSSQGGNVQTPQTRVSSAQQWISGGEFPGKGGRDGSTNAVPQEVGAVQCPARDASSIPDPATQAMAEESQEASGFVIHGGPFFI